MSKSVAFNMPAPKNASADDWIEKGVEPHLKSVAADSGKLGPERDAMKRLTLDIPAELHARVKMGCLRREKTMLEVICDFLRDEFPEQP